MIASSAATKPPISRYVQSDACVRLPYAYTGQSGVLGWSGLLPTMVITDPEFQWLRHWVREQLGIHLSEQKRELVVGRLQALLREQGFASFHAYCHALQQDTSGHALNELVNRITTNYTYFYREPAHFEFLWREVFPPLTRILRQQNNRDLRLWSAGCSTGEEAYLLAMLQMDYLGAEYPQWRAGVLATDISQPVLEWAKAGIYSAEHLERLPDGLRRKYFQPQPDCQTFRVHPSVRDQVVFRRLNLMNPRFPFRKPFQVIFCRNVMIYFDEATRRGLLSRLHQCLEPGGYLFIGHAESLGRQRDDFEYILPAVYRRR